MRFTTPALAALFLLIPACKHDADSAASPSVSAGPTASAADPGAHGPPVVVRLTGADSGSGESDVTIEIEVRQPIAVPATLRIRLPQGATLTTGVANDSIDVSKIGSQKRQIHVKSDGALTDTTAVEVSLEARDLDAGTGFRAERQWPPHVDALPPGHGNGPRPPGGRPAPMPAPQSSN